MNTTASITSLTGTASISQLKFMDKNQSRVNDFQAYV